MAKPAAPSARDRKAANVALGKIDRQTTAEGDVTAAVFALRRLMDRHDCGLADIVGWFQPAAGAADADADAAALREELAAVTRERNKLAREVADLREKDQARIAGANAAREEHARRYAREVWNDHVAAIRRANPGISSTGIAAELTRRGVPTPAGAPEWNRKQYHRLAAWLGYKP